VRISKRKDRRSFGEERFYSPFKTWPQNFDHSPRLHVSDLDGTASIGKQSWTATAIVTVHDADHKPVSGAVVRGSWSDGKSGSCTTTRKGQCKLTSNKITLGSITFTVGSLNGSAAGTPDMDLDGDSNGTSITISK
jgi:hypothetical protein